MSTIVVPTSIEESVKLKLRKHYGMDANIQPGYIRVEKIVSPTDVNTVFTLNQSSAGKRPLEFFLSQNDHFAAISMAMFFQKVAVTGGVPASNANSFPYAYPDKTAFAGYEDAITAFFQGTGSFKAGSDEVINRIDFLPYMTPTETQDAAATQPSYRQELFRDFSTVPVFQGNKQNQLIYSAAAGGDFSALPDGATESVVQVIYILGLTIRNAGERVTREQMIYNGLLL